MASNYNLTLTDGSALATIYALESNGTSNQSVPRQIIDISFDPTKPYFVVADDVTARFVNGFSFSVIGSSPYDGAYTVDNTLSPIETVTLSTGQVVTHIPLATPPTPVGFNIVGVNDGASGSWILNGPTNGYTRFYPTSTFTVAGNTFPAANGSYTVASSTTGNQFNVLSVTGGLGGSFTITGDVVDYFQPTTTFHAVNTGGYDAVYTIDSVALVTGNTVVTVLEYVNPATNATNALVVLDEPNTIVVVTGTIAIGASADGTIQPTSPTAFNFVGTSPIVVTPTTPQNYLVTFRITGDQSAKFPSQAAFQVHNVLYNGTPYTNSFVVSDTYPVTYNVVSDRTEIIVELQDSGLTTPALSVTDTHGYQDVNFSALAAGSDPTNLIGATVYTAVITVDGVAKNISVLGSDAPTFTDLIAEINTDLAGAATAALDIANDRIRITSGSTGSTSIVSIVGGTLFDTQLANFTTIGVAVNGTNVSWVVYPIPVIPYGHIQYTVSTVSSSLQLLGPGCPTYNNTTSWGHALFNNTIHMLENFNNTTAPVVPLEGQLWYNPTGPELSIYGPIGWNGILATNWPASGILDMNNYKIVRVTDAATTYPYVASSTGLGNNDQEVMNLRTSDLLYIAKTGGSSAVAAERSGTLTGSLNLNGASPVGHTAIGINLNSAPMYLYGTAGLDFKTGGTGSITFEAVSTGGISILGTGDITVTQGDITVTAGNVAVGSGTDKVTIQNNVGTYPTITFATTTTQNPVLNLATNKIINLSTPTDPLDGVNKAYVDSLVNGIIWIQPVKDPNLFDDTLTAPPVIDSTIPYHKTYIVGAGATGAWTGLDGRAVVYDALTTSWIDVLGRVVQIGDRFGVFAEPDDDDALVGLPAGGLTGKAGKVVTIATVTPYTYTDYTPIEPDAFSVTGIYSPHYGHAYTFRGTWGTGTFGTNYAWIEFSGPQMLVDGAGLRYTGNILNVGAGFGIAALADTIEVNQADLDTIYVQKAGDSMDSTANLTFVGGGEVLGLPVVPSGDGAAASKKYVDDQDALNLPLTGGSMNLNANITLSGTGEVLGLPAVPTTGGSATSKTYVDTQISGVPSLINENLLINGRFDFWQRSAIDGTSLPAAATARYLADRWKTVPTGSTMAPERQTFTLGQTDVPGNPTYFHRCVVASVAGVGNFALMRQHIEDVRLLGGETATVSFWAKADAAKNIAFEATQHFGTGGAPSAEVTTIGVTTCALTTTWQKFSFQVTFPSIAGKTLGTGVATHADHSTMLNFWLDAGSNFDARTNTLGQQSGTFDFAMVKIEKGTIETAHRPLDYQQDLAKCQRFYETSIEALASDAGSIMFQVNDLTSNTHGVRLYATFKVTKRAIPVATAYSIVTFTAGTIYDQDAGVDIAAGFVNTGTHGGVIHATTALASTSLVVNAHYAADSDF